MTSKGANSMVATGRACFGCAIAFVGLQHIYNANFVAVVLPPVSNSFGPVYFFVCLAGMLLFFTGLAIALGAFVRAAGLLLGFALLAALALGQLPALLHSGAGTLASWTDPVKLLALSGGAFIAASAIGRNKAGQAHRSLPFGRVCLAVLCLVFGSDHFAYSDFVSSLIPHWIPEPRFWAYGTGLALIAAGVAFLTAILVRTAAAAFALMVLSWLAILHVPLALRSTYAPSGEQWTNALEALAFAGIALMLAGSGPRPARQPA